jgi:hypothetical protein
MSFWDSLFGGGEEESGRTESTRDTSSTTTLDPRYQQAVYGATDRAVDAFSGKFNPLNPNQYVAGPNSDLTAAWAGIRGLRAPGEYDQAGNLYNQAANFQAGNYDAPSAFGSYAAPSAYADPTAFGNYGGRAEFTNYNAPAEFGRFNAPDRFDVQSYAGPQAFGNYDLKTINAPQNFSAADAKQYMDPFNEAVTEQARQQAIREGNRQAALTQLQSSFGAGLGSSNAALQAAFGNRNMANTIADITTKGNSAAFREARDQFNADVNRRLGIEQFNIGAGERAYGMNQATAGQNEAQRLAAYNAQQRARESGYGLNTKAAQDAYLANQATYGMNTKAAQDAYLANQATYGMNTKAALDAYLANQNTAAQNEAARAKAYGLNADTALNAYNANAATYGLNAKTALDAFNANQQGRQFAANLGLEAAQGLGALGTARQAADLQRYNARAAVGADRRNIENQKMAIKLQQALKGQDISREDAYKLAQILSATRSGETRTGRETGTSREFSQTPSLMSQLGGLAGSAASMYLGAPMMLGNQGINSIGGLFDNANNFWTGGGGNSFRNYAEV